MLSAHRQRRKKDYTRTHGSLKIGDEATDRLARRRPQHRRCDNRVPGLYLAVGSDQKGGASSLIKIYASRMPADHRCGWTNKAWVPNYPDRTRSAMKVWHEGGSEERDEKMQEPYSINSSTGSTSLVIQSRHPIGRSSAA